MKKPTGLPDSLSRLNRTAVMGILNVTPDSFSDGGQYDSVPAALKHAQEMMSQGADIIDVGGESTRPGAARVSVDEELARVIPVVQALSAEGIVVSVDTMRSEVAHEAIHAGATIINDVSGGLADENMFRVIQQNPVAYIMMHWRGHADEMGNNTHYQDVVTDVVRELRSRVNDATSAGIDLNRIAIDPGIGFAKLPEQNWPLLREIQTFIEENLPVLVGVSRKRFLGEILATSDGPRDVRERDFATTALTTILAQKNIWAIRVHNVQAARDAITVVEEMRRTQ